MFCGLPLLLGGDLVFMALVQNVARAQAGDHHRQPQRELDLLSASGLIMETLYQFLRLPAAKFPLTPTAVR